MLKFFTFFIMLKFVYVLYWSWKFSILSGKLEKSGNFKIHFLWQPFSFLNSAELLKIIY